MAEITLRAIEKEDLKTIQRWRNSSNVMPYCRQYRPLSMQDMEKWYQSSDKEYNLINDLFLICLKDGTPIGVGGFVRIDWRNRKAEVSFYIGEDSHRNRETIKLAISHIVQYGKATLNLWKVYFPCYSFNPFLPIYEEVMPREYI